MLVLARQVTERIILPTVQTSITVTAIRSGVIRLGIDAPPCVPVFREELLRRPTAPQITKGEVGWDDDKHLWIHQFDLLLHILQTLVQQPLIRSHPGLEEMLLHSLDQLGAFDQQMRSLTTDTPLPRIGALVPAADE